MFLKNLSKWFLNYCFPLFLGVVCKTLYDATAMFYIGYMIKLCAWCYMLNDLVQKAIQGVLNLLLRKTKINLYVTKLAVILSYLSTLRLEKKKCTI